MSVFNIYENIHLNVISIDLKESDSMNYLKMEIIILNIKRSRINTTWKYGYVSIW